MRKGNDVEIVKIKDYDNEGGMTADEADAELKKRGLVPPTMEWWMSLTEKEAKKYAAYTPLYLGRNKNGLGLAAGSYDDVYYWRGVAIYRRPSNRAGVLGMKQEKEETPKTDAALRTQDTQLKAKLDRIGKILEGKA